MADIQGVNPETGELVTIPQEAAAQHYKQGKLRFKLNEKVPILLDGQPHTIHQSELDSALANGAELNFDPHGAVKAAAAGAARGLTLGGSDWAAVQGQKILGDSAGAEHTRQALEGLQREHPVASATGELGGAAASMFIPGVGESEAARAPELLSAADQLVTGEQAAASTGSALRTAANVTAQTARTNALKGTTQGSLLSKAFRAAVNPMSVVGEVGGRIESTVGTALGGGKFATNFVSPMTRAVSEGALIGAANGIDESELGGEDLTGEALLASMDHGALWGGALGLVSVAGKTVLTSAGRMANRLAEGQFGASPRQIGNAADRWGAGGLGGYALERGWSPLQSDAGQHAWAAANKVTEGSILGQIVKDAGLTGDMSAQEGRQALEEAMRPALEKFGFVGGNASGMKDRILAEYDKISGLRGLPDRPPIPTTATIQAAAEDEIIKGGLSLPKAPSRSNINKLAHSIAAETEIGPNEVRAEIENLVALRQTYMAQGNHEMAAAAINKATNAQGVKAELEERVMNRAQVQAKERLSADYAESKTKYDQILDQKVKEAEAAAKTQEHNYNFATRAVKEHNENSRISFENARGFRKTLGDLIPWASVNNADAATSALNEVKRSAYSGLEGRIEKSLDESVTAAGKPELSARYAHAKERYGMAAELEKMTARGRNREASHFGRGGVGGQGIAGHVLMGAAGAAMGHPFAGIAMGAAYGGMRHYGPRLAAWALHKAARMAEIKAVRQELQIAARRSVRAALSPEAATESFARLRVPDLPPHELKKTAAKAMQEVAKMGRNQVALRGRLTALDPHLPILAPNSFNQAEGAFRRGVSWLGQQIPPHLMQGLAQHDSINPKDLTDSQARDFMDAAAVSADPRVAFDAIARGNSSAMQTKTLSAVWPALKQNPMSILHRAVAMDRESMDFLHPGKKAGLSALYGQENPSLTLAAQAVSLSAQSQKPQGKGMINASSGQNISEKTSKGLLQASMQPTAADGVEGGPAGRRGRKGSE